ncbi:outer membrane protein [Vibrio diazotrophicus]|uniref:outer membrane protein n=1 Tax=Vibrio diazotrophicus TaxID=685 RepID=UPI00142DBD3E|nr:porin family protein [Vibrio diazotrophicus]NIY92344.1 porin family protein [Vibrio diazotrophicus]
MKFKGKRTSLAGLFITSISSIYANAADNTQWDGLYGGFGIGGLYSITTPKSGLVMTESNSYFTDGDPQQVNPGLQKKLNDFDLSGSLILGYNLRNDKWLYGIETDLTMFDYQKSNTLGPTGYNSFPSIEYNIETTVKTKYSFSLRLQAGYIFDDLMVHMGIGPSISTFKYTMQYSETGPSRNITSPETYMVNSTKLGTSSNIGVSYKLDDNWSLRGDYVFNYYANVVDGTQKFKGTDTTSATINHKTDFLSHNVRFVLIRKF